MTGDRTGMTAADVVKAAEDAGVQLVRFLYCDHSGVTRGKVIHARHLADKLTEGVGLTRAQMAINLLEELQVVEGMEPVGEIRLVPDPGTFSVLPWDPLSASVICDQMDHDGKDWGACQRSFLKRAVARAASMGVHIEATFENEFYLAREVDGRYVPLEPVPVYSSIGLDQTADVMHAIVGGLEAQGIHVEQAINEYGAGQEEISGEHAPAVTAADHQIKFRDTVRGVALRHGLLASFTPKPFPDEIGAGAHIHFSLWDRPGGKNLLYDPAAPGNLSAFGKHFLGGVLTHLRALTALTCPNYNSYRRLQPHAWSSAYTAWGYDNREAALRIASPFWGREEATLNCELKTSDASANPYLSLGGLIFAGLDGVEGKLDPGESVFVDPGNLTDAERAARGIRPLPSSMDEALDELEKDSLLMGAMGDLLRRSYLIVRRSEARTFAEHDTDFEIAHHFYRF